MTHYKAHCCQTCGAEIGYVGRAIDFIARRPMHKCKPDRILVDREGVAYLPTREVKLRAVKSLAHDRSQAAIERGLE